jgi:hypothetical protein
MVNLTLEKEAYLLDWGSLDINADVMCMTVESRARKEHFHSDVLEIYKDLRSWR